MLHAQALRKPHYEMPSPRSDIAGIGFDLIDPETVLGNVRRWQVTGHQGIVSMVNPHSVLECHRDREMDQSVRSSSLILPDGIGIILGANMLSHRHRGRVSGPELLLYLCDKGRAHGFTHYFYGGEPGVAERIAGNLEAQLPGLNIAGCYAPPFRSLSREEEAADIARINAERPTILWLGLGAPKQEKWMARHANRIAAAAMIGVGAAFDFHSGNKAWCPAGLRKAGLEWAYRLANEPRRLWRRNLDSFTFLALVAGQIARSTLRRGRSPHRFSR